MKASGGSIVVADGLENDSAQMRRAESVRKVATAMARSLGLGIELVHVESYSKFGGPNFRLLFENYRDQQMSLLKKHAAAMGPSTKPTFVFGDPVTELLKIGARKNRPELVAMATHGRKGLQRIVLGSVAEDVIRNSRAPILTLGPKAKEWKRDSLEGGACRIVLGTDLTRSSQRAESYALRLAKRIGANVTLVHCLNESFHPVLQTAFRTSRRSTELADLYRKLQQQAVRGLEKRQKLFAKAGVTADVRLDEKEFDASDSILAQLKKEAADFAVIGTHGRNLLEGSFLGSSARQVILEATVPVITIR